MTAYAQIFYALWISLMFSYAIIGHLIQLCLHTVICFLGILMNGIVLLVYLRVPSFQTMTNMLIVHQSFIDFISSILFLFFYVCPLYGFQPTGVNGIVFCKCRSLYWILTAASKGNLLGLALERYYAVIYPIRYRYHFKKKTLRYVFVCIWIYGVTCESNLAYFGTLDENNKCTYNWSYKTVEVIIGSTVFTFECVLPLLILGFAYGRIACALGKPRMPTKIAKNSYIVTRNRNTAQRNVIITSITVSVIFLVCWTPNQILYLFLAVIPCDKPYCELNGFVHSITIFLCFINMMANPFVYALKYKAFRKSLKQLLSRVNNR
ncbi:mu-type opioid receptor-like [Anneissia japonica]|uniref:mu-type opioid receptor-like n=1 Tax=Anneissia japonica TaxID=1529436 RepID=UPI001425BA99|nr:mu-type opioid receptor-like [Anneissia japonica]